MAWEITMLKYVIQQNRHYLETIVEVILLCAKQD